MKWSDLSNMYRILVLSKKVRFLVKKKLDLFKIGKKRQIRCRMRIAWCLFIKLSFFHQNSGFLTKIKKFGEIANMLKFFFEKERFFPLQGISNKVGVQTTSRWWPTVLFQFSLKTFQVWIIIIFRRICNMQEKLFIQQGRFFSVQNCQNFLFKNKWQQWG